jgi:hypothetical protein
MIDVMLIDDNHHADNDRLSLDASYFGMDFGEDGSIRESAVSGGRHLHYKHHALRRLTCGRHGREPGKRDTWDIRKPTKQGAASGYWTLRLYN